MDASHTANQLIESTSSKAQEATFDSRLHPVLGVDAHLPIVPLNKLEPAFLRQLFKNNTSTSSVYYGDYPQTTPINDLDSVIQASVLFGIVNRPIPGVLLTQRSTKLRKHSGQIAFAGGRVDDGDESDIHAALREAQEEVGLDPRHVEVLGVMPKYLTGTCFVVTPVVGLISPEMSLKLNEHEVSDAFEVPLAFLMDPGNHRRHARELEGRTREWFSMPYKQGEIERFIWGATAGMIRNMYHFLINN